MEDRETQAVGAGIVFGAGIGATIAVLANYDIAMGAGFGAGAGIIVAAIYVTLRRGNETE